MIEIKGKLKPFSHRVGVACLVPGTAVQVQVFPMKIRFWDMETGKRWEEELEWKGPVEGFTVEMDLEKGGVRIFGKKRERWIAGKKVEFERLSLGKHKKLDWELVVRRMQVEEMVPVLFALGQMVEGKGEGAVLGLLKWEDKREVVGRLRDFLRVGFSGMMVPRLTDDEFQGVVEEGEVSGSPLALLVEGYQAVRMLIFQENSGMWEVLPSLPPEWHAGRVVGLQTGEGDKVFLEWSGKQLRQMVIRGGRSRGVIVHVPKPLVSCRVNRGKRHELEEPLELKEGQTLFLDRFEK